jgi:hypothetical protein
VGAATVAGDLRPSAFVALHGHKLAATVRRDAWSLAALLERVDSLKEMRFPASLSEDDRQSGG